MKESKLNQLENPLLPATAISAVRVSMAGAKKARVGIISLFRVYRDSGCILGGCLFGAAGK